MPLVSIVLSQHLPTNNKPHVSVFVLCRCLHFVTGWPQHSGAFVKEEFATDSCQAA